MPFPLLLSEATRQFIAYLDDLGPWRYLEVSYYLREYEIIKLDRAVWEVRRHAEPHNYWIREPDGQLRHTLPFGMAKINGSENKPPPEFLVGGLLEKIIADRKHGAREPLLWQNAFYGRKRKTICLRGHMNAVNAPLFLHPEILTDVQKYVFIPREVAAAYRQLAEEQLAERATKETATGTD